MKRLFIGIGVATVVVTGSAMAYRIYWKIERNKKREILMTDPAKLGYEIVEEPKNKEITYYKKENGERLDQWDYRTELGYLVQEITLSKNHKKIKELTDIFYKIKEESDKIYKNDITNMIIEMYEEEVKFKNKGL